VVVLLFTTATTNMCEWLFNTGSHRFLEHRIFQKRVLLAAACLTQPGRPYSSLV
jgi:hypothetical protein